MRELTALTDQLVRLLAQRPTITRKFAAVGVIWPSLKWADDVVTGGALAVAPDETAMLHESIRSGIEQPAVQDQLQRLVEHLDTPAGRAAFVQALRAQLPPEGELSDDDALPAILHHGDPEELFGAVEGAAPDTLPPLPDELTNDPGGLEAGPPDLDGGALPAEVGDDVLPDLDAGAGASFHLGLSDLTPTAIARHLVNLTSYYLMKDRAGKVGAGAVAQVLEAVHAQDSELNLHLAGHSFGARVVSRAATVTHAPVHSATLLQGAFSHLGFAPGTRDHKAGAFRDALTDNVAGPVVVTHTHRDLAVFLAYAIASRLARQSGDSFGDSDDPYGGLGANGAVDTPEAVNTTALADVGFHYLFSPKHIHNLRADRFVSGHSDIRGEQVANALLQAMLAPVDPSSPRAAGLLPADRRPAVHPAG